MEDKIMVTVQCITYNHEPYIRQCLEGFVMQKTNFRFEAIVHDDASTDNTAAIIREFAAQYPDIIKPIYETENQYSKGDCSLDKIMNNNTHGKYVASCEGDDYWTDPMKLQKQFDFMEGHPDYALCFHNAMIHHENSDKKDKTFAELEDREYTRRELTEKWLAPTASFFFLKSVLKSDIFGRTLKIKHRIIGDLPLIISASYCGRIYGFSDTMSVYRRSDGGIMDFLFNNRMLDVCHFYIEMRKTFKSDYKTLMNKRIGACSVSGLSQMKHKCYIKGFTLWWLSFSHAPINSINQTVVWCKIINKKKKI